MKKKDGKYCELNVKNECRKTRCDPRKFNGKNVIGQRKRGRKKKKNIPEVNNRNVTHLEA